MGKKRKACKAGFPRCSLPNAAITLVIKERFVLLVFLLPLAYFRASKTPLFHGHNKRWVSQNVLNGPLGP